MLLNELLYILRWEIRIHVDKKCLGVGDRFHNAFGGEMTFKHASTIALNQVLFKLRNHIQGTLKQTKGKFILENQM